MSLRVPLLEFKTKEQAEQTMKTEQTMKKIDYCGGCLTPFVPPQSAGGVGYAIFKGVRICYKCAANEARRQLLTDEKCCHFIDGAGMNFITWDGTVIGKVVAWGNRHNFSSERHYVTIRDCHGQIWHGIGAEGQYAPMRKAKSRKEAKA